MHLSGQGVSTPATRDKGEDPEGDRELTNEEVVAYRSVAMHIAHLVLDSPDLQQCTRELAQGLESADSKASKCIAMRSSVPTGQAPTSADVRVPIGLHPCGVVS